MMRAAFLALLVTCAASAQTADAPPTFEAASIKPSGKGQLIDVLGAVIPLPMRGGPGTNDPGQISFANASLKTLVAAAYGVKRYQVSGPDWLDAAGFNILAKVAPGVTKEQVRLMLQNLLADRFQLALHIEKRELAVYAMVVAKGGLKMKPSQSDPEDGGTFGARDGHARWVSPHTTLQNMAEFLSPRLDRPVIDKTGLTDKYDIALTWEAENLDTRLRTARGGTMPSEGELPASEPAPTIFGAVQQLGLKLERSTAPTDVLFIDHVEKTPSEN
jgi:uncharacterized protein (TIGR03435 family)